MAPSDNILAALGQANYIWQIGKDRIDWSENFHSLLGFRDGIDINSARGFETLLSSDSQQTRFAALQGSIANDKTSEGGVYQCVYAISPKSIKGNDPVWIEDIGRWYLDEHGKPDFAEGIVRIVSERRNREEQLKRKSELDELTQLPNRAHLQEMLDLHIRNGLSLGRTSAFVLVSLGDFDRINSTFGFAAGDEVLTQVAEILKTVKRDGDIAARFSGAKFGFILNNCDAAQIEIAARRMLRQINGKVLSTSRGPVSLKVSAGACLLPRHATNAHEAIAAATSALDQAKTLFGARMKVYSPGPRLDVKNEEKLQLLDRFVKTIEQGEMHLAFQPVVSASSNKPAFHEALLRMRPETEGVIEDAAFLEIAEGLGLMRLLDMRALDMVLDTLEMCPEAVLSVNLTHDSLADGSWIARLEERITEVPDMAPRLIVELTESQLVSNLGETCKAIEYIRGLGSRVAIDDFGAGYTSFSHLRDLPIDMVKLDGSFCKEMAVDPRNASFLEAIQRLADCFEVETVIEWVEDIETATKLKEMGVTYLQGSLFGMPLAVLPWEKKRQLLRDEKEAGSA